MCFSRYMPRSSFYSWFRRSVLQDVTWLPGALLSPPVPWSPHCLDPQTQPLDEVPSPNCLTRGVFTLLKGRKSFWSVVLYGLFLLSMNPVLTTPFFFFLHLLLFFSTCFFTSKSTSSSKLIKQNESLLMPYFCLYPFPSRLIINRIVGNDYEER